MDGCVIQQSVFAAGHDEMRVPVFCPKPRRIRQPSCVPEPICPLRPQASPQADLSDLRTGAEFIDIFLTKGGDSTPPFFSGSPPTRSANPLIHDARFGEATPVDIPAPIPKPAPTAAPASARMGCARAKFGFAPAAVRVEGFDCLDHGRSRSCGIPAVA